MMMRTDPNSQPRSQCESLCTLPFNSLNTKTLDALGLAHLTNTELEGHSLTSQATVHSGHRVHGRQFRSWRGAPTHHAPSRLGGLSTTP